MDKRTNGWLYKRFAEQTYQCLANWLDNRTYSELSVCVVVLLAIQTIIYIAKGNYKCTFSQSVILLIIQSNIRTADYAISQKVS